MFAPALALLLVLAGGLLFRHEAAAWLARSYLEGEGIAVGSLQVTRLTVDTVELSDVVLGEREEASLASMRLVFALDVFTARPERVEIDGLTLRLDLSGRGPPLGSLQAFIDRLRQTGKDGDGDGDGTGQGETEPGLSPVQTAGLPLLRLNAVQIVAETGAGPMAIAVDGGIDPGPDDGLIGAFSARADSPLGRLTADIRGRMAADGTLDLEARLDEGRIAWKAISVGRIAGSLDVALTPERSPLVSADLSLADVNYRPADSATLNLDEGRLTAEGGLADFAVTAMLSGQGESLLLTLAGGIGRSPARQQTARLAVEAELRTAGALAGYLPLPGLDVETGALTFLAQAAAAFPPVPGAPGNWAEIAPMIQSATATFDADVILADVALADRSSGLSAHLPLTASLEENRLEVRLKEDGKARIEQPAAERLLSLGVPADLLPLLESGLSMSLAAQGPMPFRLAMSPAWPLSRAEVTAAAGFASEQGLGASLGFDGTASLAETGQLDGLAGGFDVSVAAERLALGGREARGVSADLPLRVELDPTGLNLALDGKGRARVDQLGGALPVRLNRPLRLTIGEAALEQNAENARYRYRLAGRAEDIEASLGTAGDPTPGVLLGATTLGLQGRFDPTEGHAAAAKAQVSSLAVPAHGLQADKLSVTTDLGRDLVPVQSSFAMNLRAAGPEGNWIRPLEIAGKLIRRGPGYDIDARASLSGGLTLGEVTARYEDSGTATAKASTAILSFAPGALQPGDISPLLEGLEDVAGQLAGEAELAWPLDPAAERGKVEIEDLSFRSQGLAVAGLSLDLGLKSLLPLGSAPNQRLTIRSIDAATAIEDIDVRFSLDEEPNPHLQIAEGGFKLGGADWRIEPAQLDPLAPSNRIVLATDNLDLDTFFRLIEVEGLSGTGILAGQIPVIFGSDALVIDNGALKTSAGGRLSLRSETLANALSGGGEIVELAIQALEDFRYDKLTVGLNKSASNQALVSLGILGHNPDVLDGQPFQFNINLESDLTSVLEALRQGYSLSDEALRRAWRLR